MSHLYSGLEQVQSDSKVSQIIEEIDNLGYSIVESHIDSQFADQLKEKIKSIYNSQEEFFGRDVLMSIGDQDSARNLIKYDPDFLHILNDSLIKNVVSRILGSVHTISLCNGILSSSTEENPQCRWHRDFPYQNFISDELLGLNVFVAIDEFTIENGATEVIPHSNKFKRLPSEAYINHHAKKAICPKGSLIIFDSMLLHRAGTNKSDSMRVGLNYNFVRPFIKQQYQNEDLENLGFDAILGRQFFPASDDINFRNKRVSKLSSR